MPCNPAVALQHLFSVKQESRYLIHNGEYLEGKVSKIDFGDGYQVYFVEDARSGKLHMIDESAHPVKVSNKAPDLPLKQNSHLHKTEIDATKAKTQICKGYNKVKDLPKFKEVELKLTNRILLKKYEESRGSCFAQFAVYAGTWGIYAAQFHMRENVSAANKKNWFYQNGDNFYMTLAMMGIARCLGSYMTITPSPRGTVKFAAFVGLALNGGEELNVNGEPILTTPGNRGTRTETDWADFGTGMGAITTYALWARLTEKYAGVTLAEMCR